MRGLTILVAGGDPDRLHAALSYAAAGAAMGMAVRLHLHDMAVVLLRPPLQAPSDAERAKAGMPTLAQMIDEVLSAGVAVTLCQSGLALNGLQWDELDSRIEAQGPVGLLGGLGDDRLAVF